MTMVHQRPSMLQGLAALRAWEGPRLLKQLLPLSVLLMALSATAGTPARAQGIIPNETIASTVPPNGDLNPYGVAFVPIDFEGGGPLHFGDILVSNFNDKANQQGTGTTVVRINPEGRLSVFFQGPKGLGLTTALGILKAGFVLVGNLPTKNGTAATIKAPGSLLILDRGGHLIANLVDATFLDGPWDLTVNDQGAQAQVFVSNVLNGTVTRLNLQVTGPRKISVESATLIGMGYRHRTDPAALVVGPTGLAYDAAKDLLYVASTDDNEIFVIPNAGSATSAVFKGNLVYRDERHLRGPVGLALAPNGDLLTTNGDAINPNPLQQSEVVEFTTTGQFVAQFSADPSVGGGAFGIAFNSSSGKTLLALVDDVVNTLDVFTLP